MEQIWTAFDGETLYAVSWFPESKPKAVLAFVHGHGTHCRRYDEWFSDFLQAGFAVISFDLRGHGRSGGKLGTIGRFEEYLEDTALLMQEAREKFDYLPVVLYGHSMGATIVLAYLQQKRLPPDLAIIVSPWLELVRPPGRLKNLAIGLANILVPHATINTGYKKEDFVEAVPTEQPVVKDPLMHKQISARCFSEVQKAINKLAPAKFPDVVPLLLMHGTSDKVSTPEATENLVRQLNGDITCKIWEEAPHQMHAWANSQQVNEFTIDWINRRL